MTEFGPQRLFEELQQRGFAPTLLDSGAVTFEYEVEVGPLRGDRIELAFKPPSDYPVAPPSGLIVCPHLLPLNPDGGEHPYAGVHAGSHQGMSEDWQYWSRPYPDWNSSTRDLDALLGHVRALFDTLPDDLKLHAQH